MRIRQRLALLGTVLATGTVLLFAGLLVLLASVSAPQDQDEVLDALAEQAARDFRPSGAEPALVVDATTGNEAFVLVADRTGRVVYSEGRIADEVPDVPPALVADALSAGVARATADSSGVELRMSARPLRAGAAGDPVVVVAVQPTAVRGSQRDGLVAVVVVAAVFTAIAGAVASWVVSGRALRPLRDLAGTAGEVARTGDVTRRLPAAKGRDEVAALAREFNAMMDRLQGSQASLAETVAQQRRFVADASHELRTPLSTIRSNAGFLVDRPDAAAPDRSEALDDLRAEADRMAGLVDDLLALARSDGAPVPRYGEVDLVVLVAEVCRLSGAHMVEGEGPSCVTGDREMLLRLFRCLVDNGRRHGGGQVWVRVGPSPAAWVVVNVWDAGPGFHVEDLPRVFDRFYRGDPARSGPGSGLGLSIAQSVAVAHGGVVHASNGVSGGAVLTVYLPVSAPAA